jgi:hypothetical protein
MAKLIHEEQTVKLEINLDAFTMDDWEVLDFSKTSFLPDGTPRNGVPMSEMLDTLDRLIVGGVRGKGYSGELLGEMIKQVNEALQARINPPSGKNGKN